jgi:hypothetical protein
VLRKETTPFSTVEKDHIMWWIIDIIAAGDLAALGSIIAAVVILGALFMLL